MQCLCRFALARGLKKAGEGEERIFAVSAWRDSPYFNDAERAVLALTESVTRLADRTAPVSDEIRDEAARYYDDKALASLLIEIGLINLWNRLNVPTRTAGRPGLVAGHQRQGAQTGPGRECARALSRRRPAKIPGRGGPWWALSSHLTFRELSSYT